MITLVPTPVDELAQAWDDMRAGVITKDDLQAVADRLDLPICAWCMTPNGLTRRSCCDDAVCEKHEQDHDNACVTFVALRMEDAR